MSFAVRPQATSIHFNTFIFYFPIFFFCNESICRVCVCFQFNLRLIFGLVHFHFVQNLRLSVVLAGAATTFCPWNCFFFAFFFVYHKLASDRSNQSYRCLFVFLFGICMRWPLMKWIYINVCDDFILSKRDNIYAFDFLCLSFTPLHFVLINK